MASNVSDHDANSSSSKAPEHLMMFILFAFGSATMVVYSKDLQQDLVDTLVPAMDHIRLIHGMLESSVETKLT